MKRIIIALGLVFIGVAANAEILEMGSDITMANFWQRNGKEQQKIIEVGTKIVNLNKLDKRVPFILARTPNDVNAYSYRINKHVVISSGLLPYLDNDDELAAVMSHEIAHALDFYVGPMRWVEMKLNSKQYEYKADLVGIDLMVKAGYNPVAAITMANKWQPESSFDFGIFTSHPKTSKRIFAMYKYIYKKYPWALDSDMVKNVNYQNFLNSSARDIDEFKLQERQKMLENKGVERL